MMNMIFKFIIYILFFQFVVTKNLNQQNVYQIGFGIGDITGPAAEINMMGYAKLSQNSKGIHTRLYSRAMVLVDNTGTRICYVNVDLCGSAQLVKLLVVEELQKIFGENVYTHQNVMIAATHTHSGPGGYFQYLLYIITQEGFIKESVHSIVSGIIKSIKDAHKNLKPGYMYYNEGTLIDSSINRSPASYLQNPKEERDKHKHDTDKTFQLLKFTDLQGKPLGMINWFAVHGVSMNNTNKLISSDNKGYAAITFEQDFNGYVNIGKGPFVAMFSQANEGDSSPNTKGSRCIDTGRPCDFVHSTCNGKNEYCVAFGPGKDIFESTKIIGMKQYEKAKKLFNDVSKKIEGSIHFIYQNINMTKRVVTLEDGSQVQTCSGALGFAFAAGTTDGEGASFFHQGTKKGGESKFFDFIRDFIKHPSEEMQRCQQPKAILIPVGELNFPYKWIPELIPTQMFEIGNIIIVALPGEFTTMSGRRIRHDIKKIYADHGRNVQVILAGLANTYSNYITTPEEYQIQRYEGGSTMFGPNTLNAYREQYRYLANHLITRKKISFGPPFPNLIKKQITLKPGVIFDTPLKNYFGEVLTQPFEVYYVGERVKVRFSAANPRNNMRLEKTFLTIEKFENNEWTVVATDAHWETIFIWNRDNIILGTSDAIVLWDIPLNTTPGIYRIQYFGDSKNIIGEINEFVGTSREFKVLALPL